MTQQTNPSAGGCYIRDEDGTLRPDPAYAVQEVTEVPAAPATATVVAKPTTTTTVKE